MSESYPYRWLTTGDSFYATLREDIDRARESLCLEMYIYAGGNPGDAIRDSLLRAARRGVRVRILLDAFGSYELPADYWTAVMSAGAQVRLFNPLTLRRIAFRDHRKLLVCDDRVGIVSGFNISGAELGDGIGRGWRDLGLRVTGAAVRELSSAFERMYSTADFRHPRLIRRPMRLRMRARRTGPSWPQVLVSGPGLGDNAIKHMLIHDFKKARSIRIISAYFLPTFRIRRCLTKAGRRGVDVEIITAGRTDVQLARYAARSLYQRLLRNRVRLFEYEAQILHTKLIVADDVVYVGSANLDTRSLNINYELLLRIEDRRLAHEARRIFTDHLPFSRAIKAGSWTQARGLWEKILERISYFILARVDVLFARRQMRKLR